LRGELAADVAAELGSEIIALLPYARNLCRADLETEAERSEFDRLCDLSDVAELSLRPAPLQRISNMRACIAIGSP